jgi:hypothetical protein
MKPVIYLNHTIKLRSLPGLSVAFYIYRAGRQVDTAGDMALAKQKIRAIHAKARA